MLSKSKSLYTQISATHQGSFSVEWTAVNIRIHKGLKWSREYVSVKCSVINGTPCPTLSPQSPGNMEEDRKILRFWDDSKSRGCGGPGQDYCTPELTVAVVACTRPVQY